MLSQIPYGHTIRGLSLDRKGKGTVRKRVCRDQHGVTGPENQLIGGPAINIQIRLEPADSLHGQTLVNDVGQPYMFQLFLYHGIRRVRQAHKEKALFSPFSKAINGVGVRVSFPITGAIMA
ncbi:MAG: hypothetical protein R6V45_04605 [Oceanipulchritudo sp.]